VKFAKPALSYAEQANLLEQRGMVIPDRAVLLRSLEAVGYYRLCAYWHPFKQPDETFAPNTSFEMIWQRYRFDRQMRLTVIDAIERVEVAVRTALIHDLAMRYGPFAHLQLRNFPLTKPTVHAQFVEDLRREAQRSREAFVEHFRVNYDEFPDLPIWAVGETMTFGAMFTLFKMSDRRVQGAISRHYGLYGPVLSSWLLTLNYVRNICAHHSRLWNRELAIRPMLPDAKHDPGWHGTAGIANNRMLAVLTLLRYLLKTIAPQSGWRERVFCTLRSVPRNPAPSDGNTKRLA
jgi:abortive infection bacteriophage resistance protein